MLFKKPKNKLCRFVLKTHKCLGKYEETCFSNKNIRQTLYSCRRRLVFDKCGATVTWVTAFESVTCYKYTIMLFFYSRSSCNVFVYIQNIMSHFIELCVGTFENINSWRISVHLILFLRSGLNICFVVIVWSFLTTKQMLLLRVD